MRAAREAVGSDALLMVDAGASDAFWRQGYKWALRTAQMLASYQVEWFEEALPPDNLRDYVLLRQNSPVPIAGGEVLTRRQSFLPWISQGAFDVVQPDATKVGGLSESRRIAYMADDHGVRLIPHGWNTALGLAADLHLAAASPKHRPGGIPDRLAVYRRNCGAALEARRRRVSSHSQDPGPGLIDQPRRGGRTHRPQA